MQLRVRYAETDQMGVVYHANYLAWCEVGRTELMRVLGQPYAELERQGVVLAVSDAGLRYHAPARYDDLVRVETRLAEARSRSVTFRYTIFRCADDGSENRLVSAHTSLIALGPGGRPRGLPADLSALFRRALSPEGEG